MQLQDYIPDIILTLLAKQKNFLIPKSSPLRGQKVICALPTFFEEEVHSVLTAIKLLDLCPSKSGAVEFNRRCMGRGKY